MSLPCPRCNLSLVHRSVGGASLSGCAQCGGLWLSSATFGAILRGLHVDALQTAQEAAESAPRPVDTVAEVACPSCRVPLRRLFLGGTDVEVDRCDEHGTWFDAHELQRAVASMGAGSPAVAPATIGGGRGSSHQGQPVAGADMGSPQGDIAVAGVWMAGEVGAEAAVEVAADAVVDGGVDGAAAVEVATEAGGAAVEAAGGALEGVLGLVGDLFS